MNAHDIARYLQTETPAPGRTASHDGNLVAACVLAVELFKSLERIEGRLRRIEDRRR